jgi:hypothetical protein
MFLSWQHYHESAKIIRQSLPAQESTSVVAAAQRAQALAIAEELATMFVVENPRYDRTAFLKAAGFGETVYLTTTGFEL